jgi:hypothetical protein
LAFGQKTNSRFPKTGFYLAQNVRGPGLRNVDVNQGYIRLTTLHDLKALSPCLSYRGQVVEPVGGQQLLDARAHQWMIVGNDKRKT